MDSSSPRKLNGGWLISNPLPRTTVGISFLSVQPNINLLLQNLDAKQPQFDTAAFGLLDTRSLIHDTLVIQQDGADSLGTAVSAPTPPTSMLPREHTANGPCTQLIGILDPGIQGIAQPINAQIQGNFTAAVNFWSGRSGLIKIPTALVPTVTDLLAKLGPIVENFLPRGLDVVDSTDASQQRSGYCCGITQARIDALGPDENDVNDIPLPIQVAMRFAGLLFD